MKAQKIKKVTCYFHKACNILKKSIYTFIYLLKSLGAGIGANGLRF